MQPLFSICFLDHICNTTSKSCRNINFRISNKPNNNLTLWPKLIFQICTKLLSACFSSSKLRISKKYTLFHFLWKTTSFTHLTQFYIPSQNEPIWKTPFFYFFLPWPVEKQKDFEQFFLDLIIPANTPTTKWVIRKLKMFYIGD